MAERFNPFPKVSGKYGAPMGRYSTRDDFESVKRFAVSGPQGEYDCGGAYWGSCGKEGPVWAVWEARRGRDGVAYVRARSRAEAIRSAMGTVGNPH